MDGNFSGFQQASAAFCELVELSTVKADESWRGFC